MRRFLALMAWLFCVAGPVTAQDDATFLERQLQNALSGAGREVRVTGFRGALSSTATLDELTIADSQGVWLTLRSAELDWNRAALLRRRVVIDRLSAREIVIARPPVSEPSGPAPEASGFRLPELPVSIDIGEVSAEVLDLGPTVLGAAARLTLDGTLRLADGAGAADIRAERIDGRDGVFAIVGSFDNATEALKLDIRLEEAAGGIAATLAGLPGTPPVALSVAGEGTLSDFAADLKLATEGTDRLAGRVVLGRGEAGVSTFRADVAGDIAPLFLPEFRDFFGPEIVLAAEGTRGADGVLRMPVLSLRAAQIALSGAVTIGSGGLPEFIDLSGRIAPEGTGPVRLPSSGEALLVDGADLSVMFDAAAGERWKAEIRATGLVRGGISARELALAGGGIISTAGGRRVTASLRLDARDLDLGDPALGGALGETVQASADIDWREGQPLQLDDLRIDGESYALAGDATATFSNGGVDVAGQVTAHAEDLSAFSAVAGRPLSGALEAEIAGLVSPVSGVADLTLTGAGKDLGVGIAEVDRLLSGETGLEIALVRDLAGTRIERLVATSPVARIDGSARIATSGGAATFRTELSDAGLLLEGLTGAATLDATAKGQAGLWDIEVALAAPEAELSATATLDLTGEVPHASGVGRAELGRLRSFRNLARRELAGALALDIKGGGRLDLEAFDLDLSGTATNLALGLPQIDPLFAGEVRIEARAARADGAISAEKVRVAGRALQLTGSGNLSADRVGSAQMALTLPDPSLVAPGLPGPLDLTAQAEGGPDIWRVTLDLENASAAAESDLVIDISGEVPLISGSARARVEALDPFSALAGRALGGAMEAAAEGRATTDLSVFDLTATGAADDLSLGLGTIDRLLRGRTDLSVSAARDGGLIDLRAFNVGSPQFRVTGAGSIGAAENEFRLDARLENLAEFIPGLSGAVTAAGQASQSGQDDWDIAFDLKGPGGAGATVSGQADPQFSSADLRMNGAVPLAAASPLIAPVALEGMARFDLALNGAPTLANLSGQVATEGARALLPALGIVLNGIGTDVRVAGGRGSFSATANPGDGGRVAAEGSIGLAPPFDADITARLDGAGLVEPGLFATRLDGTLRLTGPAAGGGTISGAIEIRETELDIPSTVGGGGELPELMHLNEPPEVRETRRRAGLLEESRAPRGGTRGYGLNLTISAPNQVFIRGRGLFAELGGDVRIGGTTDAPVPSGQFDLLRGRLDILGRRLDLVEGNATLTGDFDAAVRLVAATTVEDTRIQVVVSGPVSEPEIEFQSEPSLPEDEVVARLLFGRGIENLSPLQAARLAGAVARLAGGGDGSGGLLSQIRSGAGLTSFEVTSDETGELGVRAGAYISDNVYTDVIVENSGDAEVTINLDLSPSLTVKGTVGNQGQSGVGVFFERDY